MWEAEPSRRGGLGMSGRRHEYEIPVRGRRCVVLCGGGCGVTPAAQGGHADDHRLLAIWRREWDQDRS
ncbi:hypothetical protein GCM10018771_64500 [Streptomyces cellulosae]|nr:hypothetical protein GCM10018771_64500 [Streptomyces cellulosae]